MPETLMECFWHEYVDYMRREDEVSSMEEQKPLEAGRNREATVLLKTDMDCRLMINNENHGALQKNTPFSVALPLGSHLFNVITQDGLLEKEWAQDVNCEEQIVCLIRLADDYVQIKEKREEEVRVPLGIECWSVEQIQQEQIAAAMKAGLTKIFRDRPDTPEMVVLPAGSYRRGEAYNKFKATIARPFAIGKYPVTVAEWKHYAENSETSHFPSDNDWEGDNLPVTNVNWYDAQNYVKWLSIHTGRTYRLLSEAEWEYASRAGTVTEYYWGDEIGHNNCNCQDSGSEWSYKRASPVGSFKPNAFGLYDMLGNTWEWLEDIWHDNYEGAPADGGAWVTGGNQLGRVMRGGSWSSFSQYVRCAHRLGSVPTIRNLNFGLRLARTLP